MFQFQRRKQHSVGELRFFETELLSKRQNDQVFSDELRTNVQPWAILRNEELVPFEHLANWLGIPDEAKFIISAEYDPGADIILVLPSGSIGIQITSADADWNGDGGRTQALENFALGRNGIAWGAGGTYKRGSKGPLVSEPRAVDSIERQRACRDGIGKAISRKLVKLSVADCLLVYARQFSKELIDEGFVEFLRPIVLNTVERSSRNDGKYPVFVVDGAGSGQVAFGVNTERIVSQLSQHCTLPAIFSINT
ncbi:MAG: hypothetical protein M3O03_03240 [Pseudomonadota bacterium]|nr:hypothetical protein [Pseudomonadota bacterium]